MSYEKAVEKAVRITKWKPDTERFVVWDGEEEYRIENMSEGCGTWMKLRYDYECSSIHLMWQTGCLHGNGCG